jgi:putative tryptophan/tyrosine transport system substrate-binding protein
MKRRNFIAGLGIAAAWPVVALAQQSTIPTIGFLHARSRQDTEYMVAAFKKALAESGFEEGRTLKIEWRFADGQYDRLPDMARELVAQKVALIHGGTDPAAVAAREATSTVPITFVVGGDPVELKLVSSFNQPAGNATGLSILTGSLEPKRLGLLRDLLGPDRNIAVLLNPKYGRPTSIMIHNVESTAIAIGLKTKLYWASTDAEIEQTLAQIEADHVAAVDVPPDPFFDTRRVKLASWAVQSRTPTMFQFRESAEAGGLMSYGADLAETYYQAGRYAARILRGERPGTLPVLQPTKFEFVINMRTAKAIGLAFPAGLISIADEVIE